MSIKNQPRFPAWSSKFPPNTNQIVYVQFGFQYHRKSKNSHEEQKKVNYFVTQYIDHFEHNENGPIAKDLVHHHHKEYEEIILIGYWKDSESFNKWEKNSINIDLISNTDEFCLQGEQDIDIGCWREILYIPLERFESVTSSDKHDFGVFRFTENELTHRHDYWGSMKDRIIQASLDRHHSPQNHNFNKSSFRTDFVQNQRRETFKHHIRVEVPDNICFIRTAQDWKLCDDSQRSSYRHRVEPNLMKAVEYLNHHSEETGCITARLVYEHDLSLSSSLLSSTFSSSSSFYLSSFLNSTSVLAFFLDLDHLERWAKSHASHLNIYKSFFDMLREHNYDVDLILWHEVCCIESKHLKLDYINCHPETGFLPFFNLKYIN